MSDQLCICPNCASISIEACLNEIKDAWERGEEGATADASSPGECPACGALVEPCDAAYEKRLPGLAAFACGVARDERVALFATATITGSGDRDWRRAKTVVVAVQLYSKRGDHVRLARSRKLEPVWVSTVLPLADALADARRYVEVARTGLAG